MTARKALIRHGLKVWAFMLISALPLAVLMELLPRWLFTMFFLAWGVFIFMPVVFAIGPLGRRFGRDLNDAAITEAEAERRRLSGGR